jgi:hypothetical protein
VNRGYSNSCRCLKQLHLQNASLKGCILQLSGLWLGLEYSGRELLEPHRAIANLIEISKLKSMPTKASMYNTCNFQPLLHNHHFFAHAHVLLRFMQPDWLFIRLFRPWLGLIGSLGSYFVISTFKFVVPQGTIVPW